MCADPDQQPACRKAVEYDIAVRITTDGADRIVVLPQGTKIIERMHGRAYFKYLTVLHAEDWPVGGWGPHLTAIFDTLIRLKYVSLRGNDANSGDDVDMSSSSSSRTHPAASEAPFTQLLALIESGAVAILLQGIRMSGNLGIVLGCFCKRRARTNSYKLTEFAIARCPGVTCTTDCSMCSPDSDDLPHSHSPGLRGISAFDQLSKLNLQKCGLQGTL